VIVDEVQDLTNAQLALVLACLKKRGQFLLCGDSNQIVHPNFFAWSAVKSLFWQDPALAERQSLHVLRSNFRNGTEVTRVANTLLKIKHARFRSIDRESNFLVDAVSSEPGSVTLLADKDNVKRTLNEQIRESTRFAVLVLRDEDKAAAARHFSTPLIFSVHEAKGLEYEGIVLYRFVSSQRQAYAEIAAGVTHADLTTDELEYRRATDKTDKALETYKFFVNALYVALTRAVQHLYLLESDVKHPLLELLGLGVASEDINLDTEASSLEEWQREARKLELQGKQEQADAIRKNVLRQTPVPWPVFEEGKLREALTKVFHDQVPTPKFRHQLFEFAACYDDYTLGLFLHYLAHYPPASDLETNFAPARRKHFVRYQSGVSKDVLKECDRHGVDHRTPMNLTPLMMAASAGNVALVDALLERGADVEARDVFGRNAFHWALRSVDNRPDYSQERIHTLCERLAPPYVDVMAGDRLVRLDRQLSEYLIFHVMWAFFLDRFSIDNHGLHTGFNTEALLDVYDLVPLSILSEQRRKRSFISAVLARNEIDRDYAYNRYLFQRVNPGCYQFNPALRVRAEGDPEGWTPIYQALNLPLIKEMCDPGHWPVADLLLAHGGLPAGPPPHAGTRYLKEYRRPLM